MNDDCLKLTSYFGERDRADGGFLADALTGIFARHALAVSLLLRGAQGFGATQALRTDRLLTLSEDLPLVSVAVDARPRIEAALGEVQRLRFAGLVTLERARMLTGRLDQVAPSPEAAKLTVHLGRRQRVGSRPAHLAVVDLLHARGVAGATVLLGVDGTVHGRRERARFAGANARVPLMVVAVGDGERIAGALPELGALLPRPLVTRERVRICKRDGVRLAGPETDASGPGQKLTVYAGEQSGVADELVRALRRAGAAGATVLRGVWGYHGDHRPHGDSLWQLRRRVPTVTVVVDTPSRIRRWYPLVDEIAGDTALVTSETVPALRVTAPEHERGGFRLARP